MANALKLRIKITKAKDWEPDPKNAIKFCKWLGLFMKVFEKPSSCSFWSNFSSGNFPDRI